jgi:hypothetical protein
VLRSVVSVGLGCDLLGRRRRPGRPREHAATRQRPIERADEHLRTNYPAPAQVLDSQAHANPAVL